MYSQVFAKTKTVEGSSIFYIPSTMTRAQAEEEAVRRAKIDALNRAFGNTVLSASTSIITERDENFYSNGFNLVKGEWIETVGEPQIKTNLDGDEIFLTVKIKGKAREKKSADIDITTKILRNCTTPNCEATEFKSGDKMYLYFTSPVDGYVSVYQHDPVNNQVYCLLPYRNEGSANFKTEHDKEYVFFSKSNSRTPRLVDEYRLGCASDGEVNTIYVMFSPNIFSKAGSVSTDKYVPRSIPFADFESWKARCMAMDAMLQVKQMNIVINN